MEGFSKETHIIHFDTKKGHKWDDIVINSNVPVIVDFYADWCGPCRKLGPVIEQLCEEKQTFKLVKVDVDNNGDLAEKYEVGGIPHLVLIKNGEVVDQVVGFNQAKVEALVAKA